MLATVIAALPHRMPAARAAPTIGRRHSRPAVVATPAAPTATLSHTMMPARGSHDSHAVPVPSQPRAATTAAVGLWGMHNDRDAAAADGSMLGHVSHRCLCHRTAHCNGGGRGSPCAMCGRNTDTVPARVPHEWQRRCARLQWWPADHATHT
jgi:hypothetical protein